MGGLVLLEAVMEAIAIICCDITTAMKAMSSGVMWLTFDLFLRWPEVARKLLPTKSISTLFFILRGDARTKNRLKEYRGYKELKRSLSGAEVNEIVLQTH